MTNKEKSKIAEAFLADFVDKECPPSLEKFNELKDALGILSYIIFDLEAKKESAEINLKTANSRILELEQQNEIPKIIKVLDQI
jgi:hypothetical protein